MLVLKKNNKNVVQSSSKRLLIFKKKNQLAPMWFLFSDLLVYCEKKAEPEGVFC